MDTNFSFTVRDDGSVVITGWNQPEETLDLPAELEGHRVTAIGRGAFEGNQQLKKVILPEGLESIEGGAFAGCKNVEYVILPNSVREFNQVWNWMPEQPAVMVVRGLASSAAMECSRCRRDCMYWNGPLDEEFERQLAKWKSAKTAKSTLSMILGILFFVFGITMMAGLFTGNPPVLWVGLIGMFVFLGATLLSGKK